MTTQHRILLDKRPTGAPQLSDFRLDEQPVPKPGEGQVLLRTIYLSLDPYMRGRMSDAPSYAPPVEVGAVMVGGAVSRVEVSRHPDYKEGDLVVGDTGWQSHAISDGRDITRLDARVTHPSYALSLLGMPGFTAYHGLLKIGEPSPGETLVVASATGAVGSVVGQIGRIKGAHVVGVAGGAEVPLRGRHAGVRCLHRSPCARFRGPARRRDGQWHRHLLRECRGRGVRCRPAPAKYRCAHPGVRIDRTL
jgi:NADPH-dependent curcumin reductase CurA